MLAKVISPRRRCCQPLSIPGYAMGTSLQNFSLRLGAMGSAKLDACSRCVCLEIQVRNVCYLWISNMLSPWGIPANTISISTFRSRWVLPSPQHSTFLTCCSQHKSGRALRALFGLRHFASFSKGAYCCLRSTHLRNIVLAMQIEDKSMLLSRNNLKP